MLNVQKNFIPIPISDNNLAYKTPERRYYHSSHLVVKHVMSGISIMGE